MIVRRNSATITIRERRFGRSGIPLMLVLALIVGLGANIPWVVADEDREVNHNMEGVAPLRSLLAQVHGSYPGQVLEVELEREEHGKGGIWVYEIKLLTETGRVVKLEYDAVNLELLEIKGRSEN